jgi:hypothetical protein
MIEDMSNQIMDFFQLTKEQCLLVAESLESKKSSLKDVLNSHKMQLDLAPFYLVKNHNFKKTLEQTINYLEKKINYLEKKINRVDFLINLIEKKLNKEKI